MEKESAAGGDFEVGRSTVLPFITNAGFMKEGVIAYIFQILNIPCSMLYTIFRNSI